MTLWSEALPHIQCQTKEKGREKRLQALSPSIEDFAYNVGDEDGDDGLYNARPVEMLSVRRGCDEDVA